MPRVSLIVPTDAGQHPFTEIVEASQAALTQAGYEVQVILVGNSSHQGAADGMPAAPVHRVVEAEPGLAMAAVAGMRAADGEILLVLDPRMGYAVEDLARVAGPLARGEADLALGCRSRQWVGRVARLVFGSSDPMSGLLGLTQAHRDEWVGSLAPVGSKVAWVLLAKTDKQRRVDIPVGRVSRSTRGRLGFNDLRQLKRLADERFGNFSRLLQFCVVGASGMVVDLTCYATFQAVLHRTWMSEVKTPLIGGPLDLTLAAALAIAIAVSWNFSLNRRLTFSYARHGSTLRQFVTYILSNALGVALSFFLRLTLPVHIDWFHRHKLAAAVVGIVSATGISFTMSRWLVFTGETTLGHDVDLAAEARLAEAPSTP